MPEIFVMAKLVQEVYTPRDDFNIKIHCYVSSKHLYHRHTFNFFSRNPCAFTNRLSVRYLNSVCGRKYAATFCVLDP